jgi:nicotinate phosphoribosyltransferase
MDREAVFHLFFRKNPFGGGYAIAAGLAQAIAWLDAFRFTDDDRAFLATLRGNDDAPLFDPEFLAYLADLRLTVDLDAIPEGTAVFAHEPLIRVRGPLLQCQLLETALLNVINFQTLIATKAARVCDAARGDSVLEFGLRRAQGVDGALAASRAAYLGGCSSTSNVLAGRRFGIPVRGTHAHSWVMSFDDELEAFKAYASAMPNNCVFLVDTYDTLEGVRRAVQVAQWLKANGHTFIGIRLDSGDLAELSIAARKILDDLGVGRRDQAGHGLRPARAGRGLQALGDSRGRRTVAPQGEALGAGHQDLHPGDPSGAALLPRRGLARRHDLGRGCGGRALAHRHRPDGRHEARHLRP